MELERENPKPLYLQLSEILRGELRNYSSDDFFSKSEDVARKFGINRLTAQKAFNVLKKEGLIYSIKSRGTFVSPKNSPGTIPASVAFVTNEENFINNPVESERFNGVKRGLEGTNFNLLVTFNAPQYRFTDVSYLSLIKNQKVSGFIVSNAEDNSCLWDINQSGIPMVIFSQKKKGLHSGWIPSNQYDGYYRCAEHLIGLGHKKIAFIRFNPEKLPEGSDEWVWEANSPPGNPDTECLWGYREALLENNLEFKKEWVLKYANGNEKKYHLDKLIHSQVTAIIAKDHCRGNYETIEYLSQHGYSVPDDISIIGMTPSESEYGLTCFKPNGLFEGELSSKLLMDMIENGTQEAEKEPVKFKFIEGNTCGNPKP